MGNGFPFIDIILFAMIAAFLVLRLRSVLGRRDGHEGGRHDPFSGQPQEKNADDTVVSLTDRRGTETNREEAAGEVATDSPLAAGYGLIKSADPSFDPNEFAPGARIAFEMILGAFAEGDTDALKPLLSPDVFGNFAGAIRDRQEAGEVLEETLVGISSTEIVEAFMEGPIANVTVKFVSEQINVTRNQEGQVVAGDPVAAIEVTDFWTFARDTRSRDPNWTLVGTRSLD